MIPLQMDKVIRSSGVASGIRTVATEELFCQMLNTLPTGRLLYTLARAGSETLPAGFRLNVVVSQIYMMVLCPR